MGTDRAVKLGVKVEPELRRAVEDLAAAQGITPSEVVRNAIRRYVADAESGLVAP